MRLLQARPIVRLVMASLLFCNLAARGQEQAPSPTSPPPERSLAEIAKESKKNKAAHAKKLLTEDDLNKGPFPKLSLEDEDNSDEIVDAIGDFQAKHTKAETEEAIHSWYSEYDAMLAAAIKDNTRTMERRSDSTYNGFWICQNSPNYQTCVTRRQAEMRGLHDDQVTLKDNGMVTGRIQQSFMKIRSGISSYGLRYSWFKIRNANGNGSY